MSGVNDSMQQHAAPLELLMLQTEEATQSWEQLLIASGGALELSKCFAYVVYWDLSEGGHCLILPSEIAGGVQKGNNAESPISLTYGIKSLAKHPLITKSPWVWRRTLEVRIAPVGTWKDEFNVRRAQAAGAAISREILIQDLNVRRARRKSSVEPHSAGIVIVQGSYCNFELGNRP